MKKWYQSKTVMASIVTVIISALEIVLTGLNGEGIDQASVTTLIASVVAIYGRITATENIE